MQGWKLWEEERRDGKGWEERRGEEAAEAVWSHFGVPSIMTLGKLGVAWR